LALIDLADAQLDLGRPIDTADHLERAPTLLSTLDKPDPYNAARAEKLTDHCRPSRPIVERAGDNGNAVRPG
jgi:hypothetical protein